MVTSCPLTFSSHFGKFVPLSDVIGGAAEALKALLGLGEAPELRLSDCREMHRDAHGAVRWRKLDVSALEDLTVGGPIPGEPGEDITLCFTVSLAGLEDQVRLMISDDTWEDDPEPVITAYASPSRTCLGVVLAIAIVLGAAIASDGQLTEEWQLQRRYFVDEPMCDPRHFVELTRMHAADAEDVDVRAERFLRRFPKMNGWPVHRSERSGPAQAPLHHDPGGSGLAD